MSNFEVLTIFPDRLDELAFVGKRPRTKSSAWKITLEKWENLVEWYSQHVSDDCGLEFDSSDTCGLCMMYIEKGCNGCPIFAKTGLKTCSGTPFAGYYMALGNTETLKWARKELRFLKKVYEEGKKK